MLIFAIDTCFGACSAAVGQRVAGGVTPLASAIEYRATGHAEALFPMIDGLIAKLGSNSRYADVTLRQIGAIAVTHGPGTFTGVRTGVAAARALALAAGIPTISVSSLRVIAAGARSSGNGALVAALAAAGAADHDIMVAMPAGRGWLYVERCRGPGLTGTGPQAMMEAEAIASIGPRGVILVGHDVESLAADARSRGHTVHAHMSGLAPDALQLLSLTADMNSDLVAAEPLYLRAPDAKPPATGALPRAPS